MPVKKAGSAKPAPKKTATRSAAARPAAKPAAPKPAAGKPASAASPAASAAVPNAIGALRHHFDYTSHDVAGIKRFYTQVMGFTQFVEEPKVGYLTIETTPTTSIGFMAPMPGPPEQWRPPGEPALYFFVKDVDRAHQELVAKGVMFHQAPTDMPWGHRLAMCRDPEGRMVCLAQVTSRG
jgi:predicted enzyme related to lactoylglutathione lyase